MVTMKRAGYDTGAFLEVLQMLNRIQQERSDGFLATHPDIDDRIQKARECPAAEEASPSRCEPRVVRFQRMAQSW
jgi:predicted Zn-dependent protease